MEYLKGPNNLKFRKKTVFVGFVSHFFGKTLEIYISQYIQAGNRKELTCLMTLSWKKAPAAAIITKKNVKTHMFHYF